MLEVVARLKKRAFWVECNNFIVWSDTWPDWVKAEVSMKDIQEIERLVADKGCYIVEGHGFMGVGDFDRRFMAAEGTPTDSGLKNALREIARGEGAFSEDQLTHAGNVIENLTQIAKKALGE